MPSQQEQELEAVHGDELAQFTAESFQDPMLLVLQMQQVSLLQKQVTAPASRCHPCGIEQRGRFRQWFHQRDQGVLGWGGLYSIAQVVESNAASSGIIWRSGCRWVPSAC